MIASALLIAALHAPVPGATVEIVDAKLDPRCVPTRYEETNVLGSGRVAVRYAGNRCDGWAWVKVKVWVQGLSTSKAIKAGESLQNATELKKIELRPGDQPVTALPDEARASNDLKPGAMVRADQVRVGPMPGSAITVEVLAGALALQQSGTVVGCAHGAPLGVCAALPSGRRVQGQFKDGRLLVQLEGEP